MNPLEDISHTRKIHAVVVGGKFFPLASIRAQALQDADEPDNPKTTRVPSIC